MTTDETAEEAAGTPSRSTANKQRLGLALSGGGFRASLFHIGVLARMAEIGLLRHIEAISTVSGGSIIGALYYIHVKKLLESRADKEIEDEQFAELVETLGREFLLAVQKNLRLLTFANPLKNMKMALPSYSRSDRIGELFDEHLYRPAFDVALRRPVKMRELKIRPLDVPQGDDFNPDPPGPQ